MKKMFMKTGKKPGRDSVRSKKGFTLVELCIVIGLLAIICVMVLAFLPMVFKRTNEVMSKKAISEDLRNIEAAVNNFIIHYDNNDYEFNFIENRLWASSKSGEHPIMGELTFDSDTQELSCKSFISGDSGWNSSITLTNINSVMFVNDGDAVNESEEVDSSTIKNKLIGCLITYGISDDGRTSSVKLEFVTHAQGEVKRRVN